jgi:hypothetical protein
VNTRERRNVRRNTEDGMRVTVTGHPDINVTNYSGHGIALYQAGAHIVLSREDALGLLDAIVATVDKGRGTPAEDTEQ